MSFGISRSAEKTQIYSMLHQEWQRPGLCTPAKKRSKVFWNVLSHTANNI